MAKLKNESPQEYKAYCQAVRNAKTAFSKILTQKEQDAMLQAARKLHRETVIRALIRTLND